MVERLGGTAQASPKLNNQFDAVDKEIALARTRMGKISAGYVHETGPMVIAKLGEMSTKQRLGGRVDGRTYTQKGMNRRLHLS